MSLPDPLAPHAAAALRQILVRSGATRPELSAALGVTKQTVSIAIGELERRGFVESVAVQQGPIGRSALRYGLHHAAGWVAGVDTGSSRLRVAAARLDGTLIADLIVPDAAATAERRWEGQLALAGAALAGVARDLAGSEGGLLGVGLAVPQPVLAPSDLVGEPLGDADAALLDAFASVAPAALWAENDVNCEAIAQLRRHGEGFPSLVLHLHVGVGVGVALVADGVVVRGARGRAGEIRSLPSPLPERGASAEEALGAAGLLAAAGHSHGARLAGAVDDLFAAAAVGDAAAESAVADEATGIVFLLRWLTTVLDPALVVLSGQLAGRADLGGRVAAECSAAGMTVQVMTDPLGDASAVRGALRFAGDRVLAGFERNR